MAASADWADSAREDATHDSGGAVESVESSEVALMAEKAALR